jgi:hypothetical protein
MRTRRPNGKIDMKNSTAAFIAAITMGIAMPALANPPSWAPAHGHRAKEAREQAYVYYPAQQVYYAPEQKAWFWMNGGNWQVGVSLPTQFRVQASSGISLTLAAERPYTQHVYVEENYGRPWREKHKDKHKDKHEEKHKNQDKHHKHHGHGDD